MIGMVLLMGVVMALVATVSVAIFAAQPPSTGPEAKFRATVSNGNVTVVHLAGEALAFDGLTVIVRTDDGEDSTMPRPSGLVAGDGDGRFEPGERWRWNLELPVEPGGEVRVLVVHEASGTFVLDATAYASSTIGELAIDNIL